MTVSQRQPLPRCLVCDLLDVLAAVAIVGVLLWVLVAP